MNYLLQIFNDIWKSGDIPKIWKQISYTNTETFQR